MWAIAWLICFNLSLLCGLLGSSLMLTAFGMVAKRGSWEIATQSAADGKRSAPRKLMLLGAGLNLTFAFTTLLLFVIARMFLFNS